MSKNNNMFKHFYCVNYMYLIMILFLLLFDEICANTCSDIIRKDSEWNNGQTGTMFLKIQQSATSWHAKVTLTSAFTKFTVDNSDNLQCSNLSCEFDNADWNGNIFAGHTLELTYRLEFSYPSDINEIIMQDMTLCGDEFVTLAPNLNRTIFDCSKLWCSQAGTSEQYTGCLGGWQSTFSVTNDQIIDYFICTSPIILYGNTRGGRPMRGNPFNSEDFELAIDQWCTQIVQGALNYTFPNFYEYHGSVSYISYTPEDSEGSVYWCEGFDEPGPHWCDIQDGYWKNEKLDAKLKSDFYIEYLSCSITFSKEWTFLFISFGVFNILGLSFSLIIGILIVRMELTITRCQQK